MKRIAAWTAALCCLVLSAPSYADWMSLATSQNGAWGVAVQQATKKQAESLALKQCNANKGANCKIAGSVDQLGYVAVATSQSWVRASVNDTAEGAAQDALEQCARNTSTDDTCEIKWTGINGVVKQPARTANIGDCRPRTRELRCRSNCVNGSCVVEYENGCKIRVQVQPRFDPFSSQWTYPSPGC